MKPVSVSDHSLDSSLVPVLHYKHWYMCIQTAKDLRFNVSGWVFLLTQLVRSPWQR